MVDEAHRTQPAQYSLGDNLFEAFPNATRIAFTGTPLIADRHKEPENQGRFRVLHRQVQTAGCRGGWHHGCRFCTKGRTAETAFKDRHDFDQKFEDLFKERTPQELEAIKKKYGASGDILEAEQRIAEVARDIVEHYIGNILPNGFKAQVVCHSKIAAVRYKEKIDLALKGWLDRERAKAQPDEELLRKVAFLQSAVVVSSDGTNEKAVIVAARKHAQEVGAIDNFKKAFDHAKPETGIAFMIVCDMLLTGFDAPVEQVMYIDKQIREHTLLQTIARVNRVAEGKTRGYVVDYIGLTSHLKEALSLYAGEEQEALLASLQSVESEMPVLESRYRRLVQLFTDAGVAEIEPLVQQQMHDLPTRYRVMEAAVRVLEDIKQRDSFQCVSEKNHAEHGHRAAKPIGAAIQDPDVSVRAYPG